MILNERDIAGLKVTVMGLGLHGGGMTSARFFASRGAEVTVTDLRDAGTLAPSVEALAGLPVRFVLGEHRHEDFSGADLVIKNPAVPPDSPFLKAAGRVETDISFFLRLNRRPILAVTGSKGKSTTAAAMHHVLGGIYPGARLGGNITISPLSFWENTSVEDWNRTGDPVVLELSSWQLADIAGMGIFRPQVGIITNILKDHQDKYGGMDAYVGDKKGIFREQTPDQVSLFNFDDPWGREFYRETPGGPFYFSGSPLPRTPENPEGLGAFLDGPAGFLKTGRGLREILPAKLALPGAHNRLNLLTAGAALVLYGEDPQTVGRALAAFPGIEHRLELLRQWRGIRFYNDSAATIPDAVAAALESFEEPVFLITGGTDKNLDFEPLRRAIGRPRRVYLLEGTAGEKYRRLLAQERRDETLVFDSLAGAFDAAVADALAAAGSGPPAAGRGEMPLVLLSPGCASFEMFLNEFDRGRKFKALVEGL